jgi:aminopeptidase-like protein
MRYILAQSSQPYQILEFFPFGYDERQYCSPGFNLPMGLLTRSLYDTYPQYHTSADNLAFITPEALADSLATCQQALELLEKNGSYRSTNPWGEPMLGKRGLYQAMATQGADQKQWQMALLWVLNLADGTNDLLAMAERSKLPFATIAKATEQLVEHGLLKPAELHQPLAAISS